MLNAFVFLKHWGKYIALKLDGIFLDDVFVHAKPSMVLFGLWRDSGDISITVAPNLEFRMFHSFVHHNLDRLTDDNEPYPNPPLAATQTA